MIYNSLTNKELVHHVDNLQDATPLERELAERVDEQRIELDMLQATEQALQTELEKLKKILDPDHD